MKKIIVSMAVMITAAFAANAQLPGEQIQQDHPHHFRHHHRQGTEMMMANKLNLSDQQKQQLKTINGDYHKKLTDLKKNEDITIRESKKQLNALRTDHKAQIQALLTTQQKNQVAKMKQERMQMAKVDANARAEKMKIKLGLNDSQASQLRTMRTDMMTKRKAVYTDNSLSLEQKHEQMKALVLQQKDQLKSILTPDQLQQLQQMRGQHHRREFTK